jgi:hypothetical protein
VNLRLTGHDPGVAEALTQLQILDRAPQQLIVVGAVLKSCEFNGGISSEVSRTAAMAADYVAGLLVEYGVRCVRRPAALATNLWWLGNQKPAGPATHFANKSNSAAIEQAGVVA